MYVALLVKNYAISHVSKRNLKSHSINFSFCHGLSLSNSLTHCLFPFIIRVQIEHNNNDADFEDEPPSLDSA